MWKTLRVTVLLLILLVVAGRYVLDRYYSRAWNSTLWVAVFPVNADGSAAANRYIAALQSSQFASIENFFARETTRYGMNLPRPVHIELMPAVSEAPPRLGAGTSALGTAWWSLKLRWYAWRQSGNSLSRVRIFVLYHDPQRNPVVPHSLGLQKGLVGVVYAFADNDMTGANAIVIAHEVLHTLGASDHYDLVSGQPLYPQGFAQPEASPRFPQTYAEIMAGRRALSASAAEMPDSLDEVRVGELTAREIRWIAR